MHPAISRPFDAGASTAMLRQAHFAFGMWILAPAEALIRLDFQD
jgi:hypothetical protein